MWLCSYVVILHNSFKLLKFSFFWKLHSAYIEFVQNTEFRGLQTPRGTKAYNESQTWGLGLWNLPRYSCWDSCQWYSPILMAWICLNPLFQLFSLGSYLLLFQYVDALILQVALLQFPLLTEIVGRTAGARVSKEKAAKGHENCPLMTPRWKLKDILYFHRPVWETVM